MSKRAKVNMAGVLYSSGYKLNKILRAVDYPKIRSVRVSSLATDRNEVKLYRSSRAIKLTDGKSDNLGFVAPRLDWIENDLISDGVGDWSISRSKVDVSFSSGSSCSLYFGNAKEGNTSGKNPVTHRISMPGDPNWPALAFLRQRYPPPLV